MTDSAANGWYVWLTELSIIPREYHYITRMISSFFITLALTPIVPIIVLVIYDVILWFWRLAAASWRDRPATRMHVAADPPRLLIDGTVPNGSLVDPRRRMGDSTAKTK
ncbi:hypothetical protein C8A00DRAFT_32855 [Chaetomidium leptoderma]|uniref:Uncharacterized protein n=1 Tax=Chaetomidium leptoderma TaxID=669021 RepID=A0AAN6ZWB0_9PEZI|nr:hypothetical protein C8A00DRAFT_32855 [Chaetomidium leptoderma]